MHCSSEISLRIAQTRVIETTTRAVAQPAATKAAKISPRGSFLPFFE
jgi:hypothetical protein